VIVGACVVTLFGFVSRGAIFVAARTHGVPA
jgi:hypothetical protein